MARFCLTCLKMFVGSSGSYCPEHRKQREKARNAARPWYNAEWQRLSKAAREAEPWCHFELPDGTVCGTPDDLTVDHINPRSLSDGVRVWCRFHNSQAGGTMKGNRD
jgi:5-methylcytosine-specific restriction endonuclease McrA